MLMITSGEVAKGSFPVWSLCNFFRNSLQQGSMLHEFPAGHKRFAIVVECC
jgi:hypothetical protein